MTRRPDFREQDHVPVAVPRPTERPPPTPQRGSGAEAAGAGVTLIAIAAAFAWSGVHLAGLIDPGLQIAGGLLGGLLGLFAGFAGIYVRYRDL
jgi:hypothetical protein